MPRHRRVADAPHPITPGPQMAALHHFFRDLTWHGTIVAEAMGLDTPEMTAKGRGAHHTIQGGIWIVGDYEQDQFLVDGTFVLTWRLHWVVGWDPDRDSYVATHADNYGHAGVMYGHLMADVLTFETPESASVRLRMTWDRTGPSAMTWRNERVLDRGGYSLIEEYAVVDEHAGSSGLS